MKIRKVIYSIHYYHLITFSTEYKKKIAPFFGLPNLQYGIDNSNTNEERIRLIFKNDDFAIQCNRDSVVLIYEGDFANIKKSSSAPIDTALDIFAAIRSIDGFTKILHHQLQVFSTFSHDSLAIELNTPEDSKLIKLPPLDKLTEFAVTYETIESDIDVSITIGNYNEDDISKFDLSPFNTTYNEDLIENQGYLINLILKKGVDNITFAKFKELVSIAENNLKKFESWI